MTRAAEGGAVTGAGAKAGAGAGASASAEALVEAPVEASAEPSLLAPQGGRHSRAWLLLTALLMTGAVFTQWLPAALLDWQPAQAAAQPWRAITAAWVHWSDLHLGTNLLAAAVVGAFGWAARVPRVQALAWAVAWPLTHLGLLIKPDLLRYGGLSGVLHAGVAIVCLYLLTCQTGRRRWIGAGVALGLVIKLLTEKPWGPALQRSADWDIAVAPLAHATGALAGLVCGAVVVVVHALRAQGVSAAQAAPASSAETKTKTPLR